MRRTTRVTCTDAFGRERELVISVDATGAVTIASPPGEAGSWESGHALELVSTLNHANRAARNMRAVPRMRLALYLVVTLAAVLPWAVVISDLSSVRAWRTRRRVRRRTNTIRARCPRRARQCTDSHTRTLPITASRPCPR